MPSEANGGEYSVNPSTSCMALDSGLGQLLDTISEDVPRHLTGVRTSPSLGLIVVVCGQYSAWSRINSTSSSGSLLRRNVLSQKMALIDGNLLMSNSTVVCSIDCSLGTIFDMSENQSGLLSRLRVFCSQWNPIGLNLGRPEAVECSVAVAADQPV